MSLNINDFKNKLPGGGARPNLFKVQLYMPGGTNLSFLAKAASLPSSNLGLVEVPYMGRQIKLAGDRTFEEWSIIVLNDTNFELRNSFEEWSNRINQHGSNEGDTNYFYDGDVFQLDRFGKSVKQYHFVDTWPSVISSIELAHDQNDAIEEFTVTLQYQYWTSGNVQ